MPERNSNSTYNLFYQRIIGTKTLLGRKLLNYKQREIEYIVSYIHSSGNSGLIMDMGCSTGQFTRVLASEFGESRVHGVDISEKSIERCQKRNPKLTFRHIGNGFYRENEGKYQHVLLSHVLEHVDKPARMLKKLQSLLRNDGSLIVSVPQERIRGDSAFPENMYNLIRFKFENVHRVKHSLGSLSSLLTETGYLYKDHRYIHAYSKGRNMKCFGNHSLVVCSELA
ncbi:MAG: class I SAM-dependent methyltransferase [Nitrospinaceae bacterium]|nr:class I SAM-dependent methyltransferase [Nitrospinaceae bacterium]